MSGATLYQQLGRFVVSFQSLENSLIAINTLIADQDYAVDILLTEIEYRRLVESTGAIFLYFVNLLAQPEGKIKEEEKENFNKLMSRCLDIGILRNRLIHSTYAHLVKDGEIVALVREKAKLKLKGGSRREVTGEDLSVESFDPYFKQILHVLAEVELFRLQIVKWKYPDV